MPKGIYIRSEETKRKCRIAFAGKQHTKESKIKISLSTSGNKNHMWKGGKRICNGYILILMHNYPSTDQQGYIPKHRFMMEQYLGRYLKPKEVVHHINGNKTDNRIENLMLFKNNGEHRKFHKIT